MKCFYLIDDDLDCFIEYIYQNVMLQFVPTEKQLN